MISRVNSGRGLIRVSNADRVGSGGWSGGKRDFVKCLFGIKCSSRTERSVEEEREVGERTRFV